MTSAAGFCMKCGDLTGRTRDDGARVCLGCSPTEGRKDDEGKRQWSLMPWRALGVVVDVLTDGARRYTGWNWFRVPDGKKRYYEALLRHVFAWEQGEAMDPDSGLPHLAHACCCILFLLTLELVGEGETPSRFYEI